ncbi:MAG TPA: hypothetical protein VIY49_08060, partial [Bryobacteraceae bacterium]
MSHLSSEQISNCLMGSATSAETRHAGECRACRAELERLETALARFRSSVRQWSNENENTHVYTDSEQRGVAYGLYRGNETLAGFGSVLIHAGVLGLLLALGSLKPVRMAVKETVSFVAPDLRPFKPAKPAQGGGGGGARELLDASKGKLPKIAPKQFTPPRVDPPPDPKLPVLPTIVADQPLPNIQAN